MAQLTPEQVGQVYGILRDDTAELTSEERLAGEAAIAAFIDTTIERGNISTEELQVLPPEIVSRMTAANLANKMQRAKEQATAPQRFVSSMSVGAAESVANLALTGLDAAAAGAKMFGADAPIREQREKLLAFKQSMMDEFNATHDKFFETPETGVAQTLEFTGNLAGEVFPYLAVPASYSTFWRTVLANGLVGGVAGAATQEDAANMTERFRGMAAGGAADMIISGLLNGRTGAKRFSARVIENSFDSKYAEQSQVLEQQIREFTGQPNFSFSLGQITANPFIVGLEVGAARQSQRAAQIKRLAIINDGLKLRAQRLRQRGLTPAEIARDIQDATRSNLRNLQNYANDNFGAGLDNVINRFGEDAIVDGRHYLQELGRILDEYTDPRYGGSRNGAPKALVEQFEFVRDKAFPHKVTKKVVRDAEGRPVEVFEVVDTRGVNKTTRHATQKEATSRSVMMNDRDGGLNAEDTQKFLAGFRRIAGGDAPVFPNAQPGTQEALARQLKRAFLQELEIGAKGNGKEAVDAIQNLRNVYETDVRMIDGVKDTMLTEIFGNIRQGKADDVLETFTGRTVAEVKSARDVLEEYAPDVIDELKSRTLERVVDRSVNTGKRSLGEVDINKLSNALVGEEGFVGSVAKGLFTEAEAADLSRVGRALQTLQETHLNLFPEASASMAQDISINLVSQSPEFVARLITRLTLTSDFMAGMLNRKDARQALVELANSKVGSQKYQMAAALLSIVVADEVGQRGREAAAKERAETEQTLDEESLKRAVGD